ncbi:hypothetical protein ACPA9J_11235 [Pseudomonas aeruginosa]
MAVVKEIGAARDPRGRGAVALQHQLQRCAGRHAASLAILQSAPLVADLRFLPTEPGAGDRRSGGARPDRTLPGYHDPIKRRAYCQARYGSGRRGAIDELKEANAAGKRIEYGLRRTRPWRQRR